MKRSDPIKQFSRGPRVRQSQTPAPVVSQVQYYPVADGKYEVRALSDGAVIRVFNDAGSAEMYRDSFNRFCTADGHSVYGPP